MSNAKTKLGITKYSIVTNSNDSVTLRLMTEHDLAMLYEWLNRSHIVEWWGGEEARPTLADVQEQYLPSVLAQESVTPYIAMLNGEPIGYAQSYVALGSGDGRWEEETDPGVRGIDQLLANASQLGKGLHDDPAIILDDGQGTRGRIFQCVQPFRFLCYQPDRQCGRQCG